MKNKVLVLATALMMAMSLSSTVQAVDAGGSLDEDPSALAMTADLVLVRPVMLATTAVGAVVWLVSSPFSLLGGNAMQAADTLVVGPAEATFVRCLGCTGEGYKTDNK